MAILALKTKRYKNFSYTYIVAYKRDTSLKDSLVRAIIHSLNLNNSNGVIYGKEGDNITIISAKNKIGDRVLVSN